MNDIYHLNAEVMVNLEMEELRKEVDSIRLIHDAGLSNPGLIERMAMKVGNALGGLGRRLQEKHANRHQAYQVTSSKLAS